MLIRPIINNYFVNYKLPIASVDVGNDVAFKSDSFEAFISLSESLKIFVSLTKKNKIK
jgi:hypothetical protein